MMEKRVTTEEMTTDSVEKGSIKLEGTYDYSSSEISLGTDFI